MTPRFLVILSIALSVFTFHSVGEEIRGKVTSVTDGDTLKVLDGKEVIVVRLEGIDAPESKQPFGTQAKKALSDLAFGKEVAVRWGERDRYGRILGHVYAGDLWVNKAMVERGMAWFYHKSKTKEFIPIEAAARLRGIGLWKDKDPVAPWDWRARQRK